MYDNWYLQIHKIIFDRWYHLSHPIIISVLAQILYWKPNCHSLWIQLEFLKHYENENVNDKKILNVFLSIIPVRPLIASSLEHADWCRREYLQKDYNQFSKCFGLYSSHITVSTLQWKLNWCRNCFNSLSDFLSVYYWLQ